MKKTWPCMLCERLYAELEDAERCERSHTNEREKGDDDGVEYGHPREAMEDRD
jgi:hypothetical protein